MKKADLRLVADLIIASSISDFWSTGATDAELGIPAPDLEYVREYIQKRADKLSQGLYLHPTPLETYDYVKSLKSVTFSTDGMD